MPLPLLCEPCNGKGTIPSEVPGLTNICSHCQGRGVISMALIAHTLGVTYRQLDYWIRRKYLIVRPESPGSGYNRVMDQREYAVAERMVKMIHAGMTAEVAAVAARRMVFDGTNTTTLPGGVIITIGGEGAPEALQEEEA